MNAFVGPWNRPGLDGCRDGAIYIASELRAVQASGGEARPWYVTNWSRLGTTNVMDQADAMKAVNLFFASGSPIQRVYWFGATDFGGNSGNNFLTTRINATHTLGQLWKQTCDTLL